MNSQQRKQFRRRWRYRVTVGAPTARMPYNWDAYDWALKKYGLHKFRISSKDWNVMLFDDQKKALEFALMWGS